MNTEVITTWADLLDYLHSLLIKNDIRLSDTITIRSVDGEWYPAELLEVDGEDEDVLDDGHLYLSAKEWGE